MFKGTQTVLARKLHWQLCLQMMIKLKRDADKAHSLEEGSLLQTGGNINYSSTAEVNLLKAVDEFSA